MTLNGACQSGSVTGFSGAGGLLQALLDFVCGTKVTGAALSGSGAGPYTATLTTTVGLGSCLLNYTVSSVDYQAQDDGIGGFNDQTGGYISSASINYSTGALSVTFSTTPDSVPDVDYVYGDDGQDWELKYQRNTRDNNKLSPSEPFGSDCDEVILHNRGLSGGENVLIGIREWKYAAGSAYGWNLTGYMNYVADQYWGESIEDMGVDSYNSTWNNFYNCPSLPLIDDTMYYWFYSDRQRIIVAVKVQSNYESCYLGFGDRLGNPEDYPYPLMIKGCIYGDINYTSTNELQHAFIPYATSSGTYLMHNILPSNAWSINWGGGASAFTTWLFPWTNFSNTGEMHETPPKKEVLMSPVIAISEFIDAALFELDGLYHVSGVGVQSEDYIRASDGIKYRVFQNISRVAYDDFMAVAEVEFTTTSTSTTTTTSSTTTTTTA